MPHSRKKIPDPRSYDIIPPDMDYDFFEFPGGQKPGFRDREFRTVNAWWFAECAFLAYCHPGFAKMAYRLAGFHGFRFFQGKGTECMVSWNDSAVITAFRGTELKSRSALHEIKTDLNTVPVDFDDGGKVHKGFLSGLNEVWSGSEGLEAFLLEKLREDCKRPLWICGHSLGGALAILALARLPDAAGAYVYGSPRVGDQEFVDLIADRPLWRVEHGRDPVPMVPPDLPALNFCFKDPGQLVFLSHSGEISFERPSFSLKDQKEKMLETREERELRSKDLFRNWADLFRKERADDFLEKMDWHIQLTREEWKSHLKELYEGMGLIAEDHQPIYYASKLWNALLDS